MPYDGSGQANVAGNRPVNGQDTDAAQINVPLADIQSMLSQVLLKSGVAPMTGNLNMNNFRVTSVATATSDGDAVPKSQFDDAIEEINTDITAISGVLSSLTTNYTATDADYGKTFRTTSAITLSISATADLRDYWRVHVWAEATTTIDPDSTNTINGSTTLILYAGQTAEIFRVSATEFRAFVTGDSLSGPQLQEYKGGLSLTNAAGDLANDITVSQGSASQDASPYNVIQLPSGITKRLDALWTVGSGNGGLDTGAVSNTIYYIWLIQRPDTMVSDVLFSLSATSPTMPASYTRKRLIGSFTRASGSNGSPLPISNVSAAQVAALTATFTRGDVGTYSFMKGATGTTALGSQLSYSDHTGDSSGQPDADSVWRRMGYAAFSDRATIWLRIS